MANQNERKNNNELAAKMISPVQFSITGATPCECIWKFTPNQLEKIIVNCCKEFIPEIESASFHIMPKGLVLTAVWLNGNCRHFINDKLKDSVINRQFREYSKEIKEFADRFGLFTKKKGNIEGVIVKPAKDDPRNLVGISIDLAKMIRILMDAENKEYYNQYPNSEKKQVCNIMPTWHFKKYKDNPFDSIEFIEIRKSEKIFNLKGAPKHIRSGKL